MFGSGIDDTREIAIRAENCGGSFQRITAKVYFAVIGFDCACEGDRGLFVAIYYGEGLLLSSLMSENCCRLHACKFLFSVDLKNGVADEVVEAVIEDG